MNKLEVGRRTHDYAKNFLIDRTAILAVGWLKSATLELGSRGTLQGSGLSAFLFNVAMVGLPKILDDIEGLHHSLYVDDVTLWVARGRDGHVQDTLQREIEAVEGYVRARGLSCSPQKSELLIYRLTTRRRKTDLTNPTFSFLQVVRGVSRQFRTSQFWASEFRSTGIT